MSFPSFFSVCSTFYNGKGEENIADVLCINVFLAFGRLEAVFPTRDGRPGAWKCLPGSGTHFLHPKNAFPGWEMTFYPQKMVSHAGNAFFTLRKGSPGSGAGLRNVFFRSFCCPNAGVPYFLFSLLRPTSMRSMMKSRMVKPHNDEPP